MDSLVGEGRLPNIARIFYQDGTALKGVTSFPSTTGPAHLPFLTGCLPGTCNVPGIRWLDKTRFAAGGFSLTKHRSYVGLESFLMGRDVWPHIRNVFELIPDSYSVFNSIARGADRSQNVTKIMRIWYWYYAHLTDRWAFVDQAGLEKVLKVIHRGFRYVFAVFPGIDEYSHLAHPHHEKAIDRYLWLDEAIGEISKKLKKEDVWDETTLWLVSDHGLSKTDHHFCVNTFLKERGLDPFFYPLIFDKKGKTAANMVSGNGMTHLYFKNHDGWTRHTVRAELERLAPGLITDLLNQPAVDIVAVRNQDGGIDALSRRGEASIRLDGQQIHYTKHSGDPFGYGDLPEDLDQSSSLTETVDSDYPDAPFQLVHLFTAPRSGDLIISATPGYDLRLKYEDPEHFGSHGSLHKSHMHVPILCSKSLVKRPARTVDVFPTTLGMQGVDIPEYVDGIPLEIA
jgi:hypothetical protein